MSSPQSGRELRSSWFAVQARCEVRGENACRQHVVIVINFTPARGKRTGTSMSGFISRMRFEGALAGWLCCYVGSPYGEAIKSKCAFRR